MTVYPLTIAQPHTRYDELAEIAWRRTESVCGSEERAKRQQIVTRGLGHSPDQITYTYRPRLLRLLASVPELGTTDLADLLELRRAQVQNLLYRAQKDGLVVGRRNPDQRKRGKGSAVHEYLWRIA